MNVNLIHGDCLEEMETLINNNIKVDMILCDLPYGVTQNKKDVAIPFDLLWKKYPKVIKPNGAIVLFGQGLFSARLITSNEKLYKYSLIWEKDRPSGFLNAKRMPMRYHEDIHLFYQQQPTYNPQFWEGKPLHGMGTKYKEGNFVNNNYGNYAIEKSPSAEREGDTKKYPKSILKFKRPHPPIHPTQKPVELCEYLIKTYTNESELILDNCMGSGTTGVASLNTKRNFIGIELDKTYFNMAKERIEKELNTARLPFN